MKYAAAALIIAALLIMRADKMPRGITNNNPGNIRRSGDKWQGLSPVQNDPEFFTFESMAYGVRAMVKVLRNYQNNHGLDTIAKIISRWAP